jgi:S-disulfanyl-L-cysteine oxidoreductase SoxD
MGGMLAAPRAAQRPPKSVWDGVYTDEQAKRGQAVYAQRCVICHGAGGQAPSFSGSDFKKDFDGLTLGDLFDRINRSMPQDKPGSLTPGETADVLAYILSLSFPVGQTEIDREAAPLKQIGFDATKPNQ